VTARNYDRLDPKSNRLREPDSPTSMAPLVKLFNSAHFKST